MEPPSGDEQIAALQARNAELKLELQHLKEQLRQQTEVTPEKAVSLLQTTLEATADGILAINAQGWVTHFNRQFVELWQVPESILARQDDWQLLPFMQEQLKESEAFLSQVRAEYAQLDLESHSFLGFRDGRVFERYSKPQVLGEDIIGRVISYRDITARKQIETELQQSEQLLQAIINAAPLRIYLKDMQGRYVMYNQNCKLLTNFSREEVIGKTDQEIFGLEIANRFTSVDRAALEAGQAITVETTLQQANRIYTYITTKFPVFDAQGNPYRICGISTDISERKRVEEELRQSEERFSKAFRSNPAATTITALADGQYLDVNDSFLRLLGFKREEVIGKTSIELGVWVQDRSQVMPHYIQQLQHQPIDELEIQFRNKSGEIRDGITSAVLIDLSGEPCMLAQLYDVTDRKRAEAALKYRLDFEALLTNISTQFINLRVTEVDSAINQALQQVGEFAQVDRACIFLISNERFFNTHQWFAEGIPPLVYPQQGLALETISETVEQLRQFKTIHTPRVADLPEPRKSLSESFAVKSYIAVPIVYENCLIGSLAFNSIQTTKTWSTEDADLLRALANIFASALMRQRSEEALCESEERFRQLAENIDSVFWMMSIDEERTLYISPAFERIWGRPSQPFYESYQEWIDSIHPNDYEQVMSLMERQISGKIEEGTYRIIRPDGEIRWICDRSFPIYDNQGRLYRVAGIATDITAHKLAEEQLEASLLEKEALLKEVHHRVKNNLQVVCSLLDLQSQRIQEPQVLEVFQNSQNRVRAMALIHEKLYQSESLSRVNLADYIQSLAMFLVKTYAVDPDKISLQLNLEPIILNLDTAIPCGLILNELISNALKHGFPGNRSGTVWITLGYLHPHISGEESDTLILVVGNNGVKLPKSANFFQITSLGFQLINVLSQQLDGQIEVSQNQGTEFRLRFKEVGGR